MTNPLYCAVALWIMLPGPIMADPLSCVQEYYYAEESVRPQQDYLGTQIVIDEVLSSIGLKTPIKAIPCSWARSASAWKANKSEFKGVPEGNYIVFNQSFVRNVIGSNKALKVALFAHEVAHILNADLSARRDLPRKSKESDADFFAGCVVARFEFSPEELDKLVSRIRIEASGMYPNQLESLLLFREGYNQCSRYIRRQGIDIDSATQMATEAISLIGSKSFDHIYDALLSDWTKSTYTLDSLADLGESFDKAYGFGDVVSTKRVGFSTLENPPRYPPGSYAMIVLDVETTKSDFLGTVTVGWQSGEWRVYEYSISPK